MQEVLNSTKEAEKLTEAQKSYRVSSFYDIVKALRDNPEWLEEIRRLILTEELLNLPREFKNFRENEFLPLKQRVEKIERDVEILKGDVEVLKEDVKVLKGDVEVLKGDVEVLKEDVRILKEDVRILKEDVRILKEDVRILKEDVEVLKKDVSVLKIDVANLKGDNFERKVRERAPAYFGKYFRKVRVIDISEWAQKLEEAEERGIITTEEVDSALNTDILIKCQRKSDRKDLLLAVEASYTADTKDAERIVERALIFSKVYELEVIPIVISKELSPILEDRFKEVLFIRVEPEQ